VFGFLKNVCYLFIRRPEIDFSMVNCYLWVSFKFLQIGGVEEIHSAEAIPI
jgi:hypothetical protein